MATIETIVTAPVTTHLPSSLLAALFLQDHPNAIPLSQLIEKLSADSLNAFLNKRSTQNLVLTKLHAWAADEGIYDAQSLQDLIKFFIAMRQQAWFTPFSHAGWDRKDIDPYLLLYAIRILQPLYQAHKASEDLTDQEIPPILNIVDRIITCPYILTQAFWETSTLKAQNNDPQKFLHQVITIARTTQTPWSSQEHEWLTQFATIVLAFLNKMDQTKSSILTINKTRPDNWINDAAKWLKCTPDDLIQAVSTMSTDQLQKSTMHELFIQTFSTLFQFELIQNPHNSAHLPHYALSGMYWQEIHTAKMIDARITRIIHPGEPNQLYPLPAHWRALLNSISIAKQPLNDEQRQALTTLWQSPLSILTGPPGSGKTQLLAVFAELMARVAQTEPGLPATGRIRWMAPTGKAAEQLAIRLKNISLDPEDQPRTIHSHFQMYPQLFGFPHRTTVEQCSNDLYNGALVVDEFTMCDTSLTHAIFRVASFWDSPSKHYEAAPFRLILSGDPDQLPPVSPGYPVAIVESLDTRVPPVGVPHPHATLTTVFRHDGDMAKILQALRENNPALWPAGNSSSYKHYCVNSLEDMQSIVEELYQTHRDHRPPILATVNTLASHYNTILQEFTHPGQPSQPFYPGDPVMYRKNDSGLQLVNGSDGIVTEAEHDHGIVEWNLPNGLPLSVPYTSQDPLVLSYAMTVHKSQGSEWPTIIFLAPPSDWFSTPDSPTGSTTGFKGWSDRRLLYTALSRAKTQLIIISSVNAQEFAQAAIGLKTKYRLSQLERSLNYGKYQIPWNKKPSGETVTRHLHR